MNEPDPELPESIGRGLRRLAAADPLESHPSAAALVSFEEDPEVLSPRTRRWIEEHLAACPACRSACSAVPSLGPAARPLRGLVLTAAAAGWIVAAILGFRGVGQYRAPSWVLPPVQTLVLSSARGGEPPAVPPEARVLRCELVLGEEVELGESLHLRILDASGRTVVEEDRRIEERNERDWPVLTLDRGALPAGKLQLQVRLPSGQQSAFALSL